MGSCRNITSREQQVKNEVLGGEDGVKEKLKLQATG